MHVKMKVRFLPPLRIVAWLPTCVLTDVEDNGRKVVISSLEVLRPAMEGHPDLKWNERSALLNLSVRSHLRF